MGLFDFINNKIKSYLTAHNLPDSYVDSSSISLDERPYYQSDDYYTYYSHPGTEMAVKVITFDERKKISYPSIRGLYVAEILLLEYCNQGKYPKPKSGYPGFWWFKYGIRDVGHALESLEKRGFIRWKSKYQELENLKLIELKQILSNSNLSDVGKKSELVDRIVLGISEDNLVIPNYEPKYVLTEIGEAELEQNGYVPYMHKSKYSTTEDNSFGDTFNVWDINKLFQNGDASNWRQVVGKIEKKRFGVNMADAVLSEPIKVSRKDCLEQKDEMRGYLSSQKKEIEKGIKTKGDGFDEETKGMSLKRDGRDKEALVQFYISIGKRFDAPALYKETAILLRKYGMYEEELEVINIALSNNCYFSNIEERKARVLELIKKNKQN